MAEAAKRASTLTKLVVAGLEVNVGLFPTRAAPSKLATFTTAGPSGGTLRFEMRGVPAPVEAGAEIPVEAVSENGDRFDPFADDVALAPSDEPGTPAPGGLVPGEFSRVLVEDGSGLVVAPEQVRRGVRLEDGSFVDCTAQLAAIEEQTKLEKMDVVSFIDVGQVQRERVLGSYYLGASDAAAPKAMRVLFESMRQARRAAVVKLTKRSRQSLGVIVAHGPTRTLVLLELVWAEDFREAPAKALAMGSAKVSSGEVEKGVELVLAMADRRESLDELRDDAIALREELHRLAESGAVAEVVEPLPEIPGAVDLEGQIEASLEAVRAGKR